MPAFAYERTCCERAVVISQLVNNSVDLVLRVFFKERERHGEVFERVETWRVESQSWRLFLRGLYFLEAIVPLASLQRGGTSLSRWAFSRSLRHHGVSGHRSPFLSKARY